MRILCRGKHETNILAGPSYFFRPRFIIFYLYYYSKTADAIRFRVYITILIILLPLRPSTVSQMILGRRVVIVIYNRNLSNLSLARGSQTLYLWKLNGYLKKKKEKRKKINQWNNIIVDGKLKKGKLTILLICGPHVGHKGLFNQCLYTATNRWPHRLKTISSELYRVLRCRGSYAFRLKF